MEPLRVPADARGKRFDLFLREAFPDLSRSRLQRAIVAGEILVDGKAVAAHRFLKGGEMVSFVEGKREEEGIGSVMPVPVLAVEKDFLVVEKPAGIAVHPGAGVRPPTLVDALLRTHPEIADAGEPDRPGIVHRLDKDVSGLMLVARTAGAAAYFRDLFRARKVEKTYLALVHGALEKDEGTIALPIARSSRRARMAARAPGQEGKEAVTHWQVLRRFANATLLSVRIETGRTHQIRAHFFAVGHPIVGDPLYKQARQHIVGAPPRPFLHAAGLAFADPGGARREYSSPLPKDLDEFLGGLKEARRGG